MVISEISDSREHIKKIGENRIDGHFFRVPLYSKDGQCFMIDGFDSHVFADGAKS